MCAPYISLFSTKSFSEMFFTYSLKVYHCECKIGFSGDGYHCTRPRGDDGAGDADTPNVHRPNNNGHGSGNKENGIPIPTCVFSVCSCPPGWALNTDNMSDKRCIEAPQPTGIYPSTTSCRIWYCPYFYILVDILSPYS